MKFTILSHAGVLVEDKGKSILFDPWLIGSCYWRSWWNFPEIDRSVIDALKPDYIYLTHLHWDHFHSPSLRLFDKDTRFLVPKIPGTRMVRDLRSIKRTNIVEIPHGGKYELWDGCWLHSFQFGLFAADSAAVVSDGETTILNANDSKIFGLPLKQIVRRFPKVDFCLRSHSSAGPLPYTIKDYKQKFPDFRTRQNYIEEFTAFSLAAGARYAIPFASNHCFLHRDTAKFNETGVNPQMVADYYNADDRVKAAGSEAVVMTPGSSWDSRSGFDLVEFDYGRRAEIVEEMRTRYAAKYAKQYEREDVAKASFNGFERYFKRFLASTPLFLRKTVMPRVLFRVTEAEGEKLFLLDIPAKRIAEVESVPDGMDYIITVPAFVLNACVRQNMFSVWTASKRLEIEMVNPSLSKMHAFLGALDFFENEGLPLRSNFGARNFSIWLSRWREGVEAIRLGFVLKVMRRKISVSELYTPAKASEHPST